MNSFPTDEELVKGCIGNDRKVQELLYRRFAKEMYAICLSYAKDRSAAQDILQDGFVKVFEKIRSFHHDGSLAGWIRRIITNTAVDHYRRKSTLNKFIEFDPMPMDRTGENNISDSLHTREILEQVRKLPDGAQVILNLYALEGFSHKEIAEKLQISEGTSKSQVNRARNLLQKLLHDFSF
jgi:RNA polymerase sigma-70 factor (ECF subfamily)